MDCRKTIQKMKREIMIEMGSDANKDSVNISESILFNINRNSHKNYADALNSLEKMSSRVMDNNSF
jgi:hypothetical protein